MPSTTDFLSNLLFLKNDIDTNWKYQFDSVAGLDTKASFSLSDLFCEVATHRAEQPAISNTKSTWTYQDLHSAAQRISDQIKSHSEYEPGNRVILLVPNSIEYIAAFYGILLSGGVVVPLPANIESGTLQKVIESTEAFYIISTPQLLKRRPELQSLQSETICNHEDQLQSKQSLQITPAAKTTDHLAAIFFTSGSSGTPKGVMLTHSNLISNAQSIQEYLDLNADERPLCVLPFHHAFGNSVLQSHILLGSHLILGANALFPESIVKAINHHRCTSFSAVPDLYRTLLERTSFKKTRFPSLRYMSVAGGALPHQLSTDISQCISPARFFVMYGQTEATARLAYVPPEHLPELHDGCIGHAVPGVTLEVVDQKGHVVKPGTVGELRAKGPNVMRGYWRDATETRERLQNNWLYTGDLATISESGWITLKGRRNGLVKISGHRVHPVDLEEFAMRTFPISQAVAVPFESKEVGTRLALYVKPTPESESLTVAEMNGICRKNLPRQLVPDFIQIVESFPMNHAMKIDRTKLSSSAE